MRSISLLLTWGILSAASSLAVAAEKTEVKSVEWYMQEENKPALEGTLKKYQNNPGELEDDSDYENAALAEHKLKILADSTCKCNTLKVE